MSPSARVTRLLLSLLLPVTSCGAPRQLHRELKPPSQAAELSPKAPYLIAHMLDGRAIVFDRWTIHDSTRTVTGEGRTLDANRLVISQGPTTVPVEGVALFETNVVDLPVGRAAVHGAALAGGVILGVVVLFVVAGASGALGSCPTFYAWDGDTTILHAEGFSTSVTPSLEATDVDALARAVPNGRRFEITMTNEALETHVVRYAHLLAARRPAGGRVFAGTEDRLYATTAPRPPARATAPEGDVAAALAAFDGRERASRVDSTDLAAREVLELEFDDPPAGDPGLVVAARQSLVTSYLFYQGLDDLGPAAGAWMASVERGAPGALSQATGIGDALGGIEVLVPDPELGWRGVGEVREVGPLAADVRVIPLPAPRTHGALRVQLRLARGAWRLDQVGLVSLGAPVTPVRLVPESVLRDGIENADARARLADTTRTLVTLPGDRYTIRYRLPDHPGEWELFLESRGYYLEWIRESWLASTNLERATLLGLRPREALRALAPEYARREAEFEREFWGTRHVGR